MKLARAFERIYSFFKKNNPNGKFNLANVQNVMEEERIAILWMDNRFLHFTDYDLIGLPDIYAQEEIFPEEGKDEYLKAYEEGDISWIIGGVNHEYLHRILLNEISREASMGLDSFENDDLLS